MASEHPEEKRQSRRIPVQGEVRLEFENFRGFITEYAANLSLGGMFIRTENPPALGTTLRFKLQLREGLPLIEGTAKVVWVRPPGDAEPLSPGMGVRFVELTPDSRKLIFEIVDRHIQEGGEPFDPSKPPPPPPRQDPVPTATAPRQPADPAPASRLTPDVATTPAAAPAPAAPPEPRPAPAAPTATGGDPVTPSPPQPDGGVQKPPGRSEPTSRPGPAPSAPAPESEGSPPVVGSPGVPKPPLPKSSQGPAAPRTSRAASRTTPEESASSQPAKDDRPLPIQPPTPPEPIHFPPDRPIVPPPEDPTTLRDPEVTSIADPVEAEPSIPSHERLETARAVDAYHPTGPVMPTVGARARGFRLSPGLIFLLVLAVLIGVVGYRFLDELAAWHAAEREHLVDPTGLLIDIPPAQSYEKNEKSDDGNEVAARAPEPGPAPAEVAAEPATPPEPEAADSEPEAGPNVEPKARPNVEPEAEPAPRLTQIRLITWKELEDSTLVTLVGDGVLRPEDYSHLRLASSPPRELVRLRGINWPFREPVLRVDTPEVQRLRTGFHPGEPVNELHIVVDLSSTAVELSKIEIEGQRIYLHLTRQSRVASREF